MTCILHRRSPSMARQERIVNHRSLGTPSFAQQRVGEGH
jgi:hypothetical protein